MKIQLNEYPRAYITEFVACSRCRNSFERKAEGTRKRRLICDGCIEERRISQARIYRNRGALKRRLQHAE